MMFDEEVFCATCGCRPAGQIPAWGPSCNCSGQRDWLAKEQVNARRIIQTPEHPVCECICPTPRFYDDRGSGHPTHWIYLCTACGNEVPGLEPPTKGHKLPRCQALYPDGSRCHATATRPTQYHGHDSYDGDAPSWVHVMLCPHHDPHKGRR